MDLDKITAVLE